VKPAVARPERCRGATARDDGIDGHRPAAARRCRRA
jgi:hypothetical protein